MSALSKNLEQRRMPAKVHHRQHKTDIVRQLAEHEAEHLSTLVTAANRSPPDADSSLKRLMQLSENRQITVTKVHLVLQEYNENYEFLVTDSVTGETCERIRLEDISKPIYKESNDPTDAYNNLLMFNVNALSPSREGPSQHEMHIFQCLNVPAHVVVSELNDPQSISISSGKEQNVHSIIKTDANQSPMMLMTDLSDDELLPHKDPGLPMKKDSVYNGYTNQQLMEKALIDAEILLLNMCFDDIESYVGHISKLQRARTLNSRQEADDNISIAAVDGKKKKKKRFVFKKRSNSKARESNMTRVTSNTSISSEVEIPISDDELVDLFEKIKFAIVLLSRLQGYVTEPNPPLLTHRMFSMMKQPIDFIRDLETGMPELAINVLSPLFTETAIHLIQASLIEPEISMWHELGDGWNLARENWKTTVPTYIPVFKCGFKPNPEQYHHTLFDMPENGFESHIGNSSSQLEFCTQEDYYHHLVRSGEKFARVKQNFVAETEQELSLQVGEYVAVTDASRNWHRLRNFKGIDGYAPYTALNFDVS